MLHQAEFDGEAVHARLFDRPGRRAAKKAGDTARALMTSPPVTVTADVTIGAAALMEHRHVKRRPVVDDAGLLVGIVSSRDLLRRYLHGDAAIEREVRGDVPLHTMSLDPTDIQVHVSDGVVTLSGKADRCSTARIVVRLVRAVDGVVNVVEEMTWTYDDTTTGRRYMFDDVRRGTGDERFRRGGQPEHIWRGPMMNIRLAPETERRSVPVEPDTGVPGQVTGPDGTVLVPVSRTHAGRTTTVGAYVLTAGRVTFRPVVDPHRLALCAVAAVGLVTAGTLARAGRRHGPSIGSVRMGPGGWVSLKGSPAPMLRPARDTARPWWARLLRAHRLVVER